MNFGPKQPQEEYYLGFDFAARMQGEAIQSATVAAVDSCGTDVTATLIDEAKQNIDGDLVYFFVRGGDDGMSYKFTCSVVGALGSRYEAEATMLVRDK